MIKCFLDKHFYKEASEIGKVISLSSTVLEDEGEGNSAGIVKPIRNFVHKEMNELKLEMKESQKAIFNNV